MNANQITVLNHLKKKQIFRTGLLTLIKFSEDHFSASLPEDVSKAYKSMTEKEDFEVIKEFAEWGLQKEDDPEYG